MPGLDPGTHALLLSKIKDVVGPVKPGQGVIARDGWDKAPSPCCGSEENFDQDRDGRGKIDANRQVSVWPRSVVADELDQA